MRMLTGQVEFVLLQVRKHGEELGQQFEQISAHIGLVSGVTLVASGVTEASAHRVVNEDDRVVVGPGIFAVVQLQVLVNPVWTLGGK